VGVTGIEAEPAKCDVLFLSPWSNIVSLILRQGLIYGLRIDEFDSHGYFELLSFK
jgi:hypothetical protein